MKKYSFIVFALYALLSLSSCTASKMAKLMNGHQTVLQEAISANLSPADKLDVVGNSFATALEEALSYSSIKKSVKHIDQYSDKNEKELNTLINGLDGWIEGMSTPEKLMLLGNLTSKPYAKKIIDLVPKFERKVNRRIQTFKVASKVVGLVKPNLF